MRTSAPLSVQKHERRSSLPKVDARLANYSSLQEMICESQRVQQLQRTRPQSGGSACEGWVSSLVARRISVCTTASKLTVDRRIRFIILLDDVGLHPEAGELVGHERSDCRFSRGQLERFTSPCWASLTWTSPYNYDIRLQRFE